VLIVCPVSILALPYSLKCRLKAVNFILPRMGDQQHFFQQVPSIGWFTMLWRTIDSTPKPPTLLSADPTFPQHPISPIGRVPAPAIPAFAQEYSTFLSNWFYDPTQPVTLAIPPFLFQQLLGKTLKGVELRTPQNALVGLVFCWSAGELCGKPTGLITWLCVHPTWRKRGIPNLLLRAMWRQAQPCPSFWFRNDGWLKSSLPPIHSETRIVRKRRGQQGYILKQIPTQLLLPALKSAWTLKYPGGVILDSATNMPRLLEAWQLSAPKGPLMTLFLQPTFELERKMQEPWCEVIAWLPHSELTPFSEQMYIEAICDGLPYTWIDAPSTLPHVESLWLQGGRSTWSAVGFDPGTPFQRPILSLQAA